MATAKGVSTLTTADVALTLATFVLVYGAIGAVDAWLLVRAAHKSLDEAGPEPEVGELPSLVY